MSTLRTEAVAAKPFAATGRDVPRRRRPAHPSGLPWVLPALVFSVGLIYYGIGYSGYISTLNWNGADPNPQRVGFQNYVTAFHDPVFWGTISHTISFFVVTFGLEMVLGFVFAALLHSQLAGATFFKIVIFVPVVLAPAIMAPVFRQVFAADGQFNWLLRHIGLGFVAQPWLAQSSTAMLVIMAITVWEWTGLAFVLYFAAMGQVDMSVLEAARIDGASNVRVLVSIIWPGVRGTTVAFMTVSAIGALKTFDVPYLVTIGGPNYATEFLGTFIYREGIALSNVGYASALSILLLILALGMAVVIQIRGRERG